MILLHKFKLMKQLLFIVAFFAFTITTTAQTGGHISYSMEMSSDNDDMAMAISMMQGSTMDLYFSGDKAKASVQMGSMMTMTTVTDAAKKKGIMLMDAMGSKIAYEMATDAAETTGPAPKPVITAETKDILGFKCTKVVVTDSTGNQTVVWVTKELKSSLQGQQQFGGTGGIGTPLEFSTEAKGMKIHFVAVKYDKEAAESEFNMTIPEGYKIMTEEEIKGMGQM